MKNSGDKQEPWKPEPPFIAHSIEFYQSEAFRSLNNAERKILARIEIEHMKHGGKENGRLVCLYDDFVAYGVRRPSIPAAIKHLETVGAIEMTQRGRRDAMHNPHHYRLTYQPSFDGKWPTNEWRSYRPNGPSQQTKPPTTIKRNRVGIRQKPGHENVTGASYENVPGAGHENVTMRNGKTRLRKRAYSIESSPSITPSEPVRASKAKPVPAFGTPRHRIRR
jgi:hypothetical protein